MADRQSSEYAMQIVKLRYEFYRDNYKRVAIVLLLSILANIVLAGVLFHIFTNPPRPKYFPTSINGRITPLYPLDKPNQSESSVLQWVNEAAVAAYSYDWVHYRQELQAASEFFTPLGWREFLEKLSASNNLDLVRAKRMVVSAVALRAPNIVRAGVAGGRYFWQIKMPIQVFFQGTTEYSQSKLMLSLTIQRISTLNQPRGIGITQFIAEDMKG